MHIEEVTHEITEIVKWYHCLPMDYSGINELMYNRVQLSTLLFFYATEIGEARKQLKRAEAQTEMVRRHKTMDMINAGQPISKAVEHGKMMSLDEYANEREWDGLYYSMKYVYDVSIEVLNTINQHIANLKKEYDNQKLPE
jgi:hypothetical protein